MSRVATRIGGLCGLAGVILFAVGIAAMPNAPGAGAPAADVFTFFLDESGGVRAAAILQIAGLVLVAVLFATLRAGFAELGAPLPAAGMLAAALIGIGAQAGAAMTLATLSVHAEDADPATSRALLDLADSAVAVSGIALAAALLLAALAITLAPGVLPKPMAALAAAAGISCGLWAGRLVTDTGAFSADGFAGSSLGYLVLAAWLGAAALFAVSHPHPPGGRTARSQ